ncbi:MAG: hypothetical protein HKN12_03635, partial [Gemmatimonadetes bacterium]|nr:hypothetical protein [Gemmatimonadota bacterium]
RKRALGTGRIPFVPRAVLLCILPPVAVCLIGLPYYTAALKDRLWSPYHDWLKPSGWVGQSAGWLCFALFLFLWLYPLRKKFRFLEFTGPLGKWLDVHIIAGVLVPLIGAIHASWRFEGLIGLGYYSLLVVAASGVVGRYLYIRIPRRRGGLELSKEEIATARRELLGQIVVVTGFSAGHVESLLRPVAAPRGGFWATLTQLVRDDFTRRRAIAHLLRDWKRRADAERPSPALLKRVGRLARREMALSQQIRMLDATHRVFRLWHLFHQPFAIAAFIAILIHVGVVVTLGATWIPVGR